MLRAEISTAGLKNFLPKNPEKVVAFLSNMPVKKWTANTKNEEENAKLAVLEPTLLNILKTYLTDEYTLVLNEQDVYLLSKALLLIEQLGEQVNGHVVVLTTDYAVENHIPEMNRVQVISLEVPKLATKDIEDRIKAEVTAEKDKLTKTVKDQTEKQENDDPEFDEIELDNATFLLKYFPSYVNQKGFEKLLINRVANMVSNMTVFFTYGNSVDRWLKDTVAECWFTNKPAYVMDVKDAVDNNKPLSYKLLTDARSYCRSSLNTAFDTYSENEPTDTIEVPLVSIKELMLYGDTYSTEYSDMTLLVGREEHVDDGSENKSSAKHISYEGLPTLLHGNPNLLNQDDTIRLYVSINNGIDEQLVDSDDNPVEVEDLMRESLTKKMKMTFRDGGVVAVAYGKSLGFSEVATDNLLDLLEEYKANNMASRAIVFLYNDTESGLSKYASNLLDKLKQYDNVLVIRPVPVTKFTIGKTFNKDGNPISISFKESEIGYLTMAQICTNCNVITDSKNNKKLTDIFAMLDKPSYICQLNKDKEFATKANKVTKETLLAKAEESKSQAPFAKQFERATEVLTRDVCLNVMKQDYVTLKSKDSFTSKELADDNVDTSGIRGF